MRTAVVIASGLVLAFVATSGGGEQGSAKKVKVSSKVGTVDDSGKQTVTFSLSVDAGWHIYANPARNKIVAGAATKVTVTGKNPVEAKVVYPPGKPYTDKFKEMYHVYDKVEIPVHIQRTANDGPLEVEVKFSACNDNVCLPESRVKVTVP